MQSLVPMLLEGLTEDSAEAGRVAYGIACEVATENLRAARLIVDTFETDAALARCLTHVSNPDPAWHVHNEQIRSAARCLERPKRDTSTTVDLAKSTP